jgi:aminoglycoside 3-N-acetyltransferase
MVSFREISQALRRLEIERSQPVIAHASLSAIGRVQGGAPTMVGALLSGFDTVVMPVFTYSTMVVPGSGPENNGLDYGKAQYSNRMAVIFDPEMPADRLMGIVPETLRRHPRAERSLHPILSFSGVNASPILEKQSYADPLAPIGALAELGGWVLLLGVNHTTNTSIHYAERLAGRKHFTRWALTQHGVRECPGFPGCSEGFQALAPGLESMVRKVRVGETEVQAVPLLEMITRVREWIQADPLALLCSRDFCQRCQTIQMELVEQRGISG